MESVAAVSGAYGDWREPERNALLGEGTYGTVYEAKSRRGSLLAVKVATEQTGIAQLAKEYQILTGVLQEAPSTIRVMDFYISAFKAALLMERLPGPNLGLLIKTQPNMFNFSVICDIARSDSR